jgi:hypothetical protein
MMMTLPWLLILFSSLFLLHSSAQDDIDQFGLPLFAKKRHFALIVSVLSAPKDTAERQACRDTWFQLAKQSQFDVLFLFAVGSSGDAALDAAVRDEQRLHRDILLLPMVESYRRLVYKTAAIYDYVTQRSDITFDFLLKTDDDSFVRIDLLVPLLRTVGEPFIYWGSHNVNVKRQSDLSHKWHDSLWLDDFYPPYALGSAYALSSDLVRTLGSLSVEARPMFAVEDVATGIWLRNAIGEARLRRVHAGPREFPLIETGTDVGVCEPHMIVRRHCHDVARMRLLFANLQKCAGDVCCGAARL